MNVYDFDNTIYDGETVVDFFFFSLKKHPSLIRLLPSILVLLLRYKSCRLSIEELEEKGQKYVRKLLPHFKNLPCEVKEFWDINQHKIKAFYKRQQQADDVIISASGDFILDEICRRLGIKHCICSKLDIKTGKITQVCYKSNKVQLFKEYFKDAKIHSFYTDSMNDLPMIKLAEKTFTVNKDIITETDKNQLLKAERKMT